ncbi:MAG TPA: pentapeptide repeat-containing protein [Terriglobales bacterium]|nr:pentapeptide repeat-containing protein [Terriglobales bacterium]
MGLLDEAREFLQARDLAVEERDRDFLVAQQPGLAGERNVTCLWVLTSEVRQRKNQELIEEELLTRFKGASEKFRGGRLYLLVDTTEGFTAEFRNEVKRRFGASIVVPSLFFDTPFKWDVAEQAGSAARELVRTAQEFERTRVPQGYVRLEGNSRGDDLVKDLVNEIDAAARKQEPVVWFISAPAGQGKTVLFRSLFASLYQRFQERKRRHEVYPRPLPMMPEHLREAAGPNVRGLIDAFLRTDLAMPAKPRLFEWMVDTRHGVWMLDGLDEVIAGDDQFFPFLEERITAPNSRPAILICVRDSLFESNDGLAEFRAYYESVVRAYRLEGWDDMSRRLFAWSKIEGRRPQPGDRDTSRVTSFLQYLESQPVLRELSSSPYYASLLLEAHQHGGVPVAKDEVELLGYAIEQMCQREYAKPGPLKQEVLPLGAFLEWLEDVAETSFEGSGITVSELREWASLLPALLQRDLPELEEQRIVEQVVMAPFLTQSAGSGRLEFTHELLAEYLLGRRLCRLFDSNPARFARLMSVRRWSPDSIVLKLLARQLGGRASQVACLAITESIPGDGFRNLVQLVALIPEGDRALREIGHFDGARFPGVRFSNLDLSGISFRGSDLTMAEFQNCALRETSFEGAVLKNTRFTQIPPGGLQGARFGEGEGFESIILDPNRLIEDHKLFQKWQAEVSGAPIQELSACPTTLQLLHLFRKFVHVNGQARRDSLDGRGIVRGKRYAGAPSYEDCVQSSCDMGFLVRNDLGGFDRPAGPLYAEMVAFVRDGALSSSLRNLLATLCQRPSCAHPTKAGGGTPRS